MIGWLHLTPDQRRQTLEQAFIRSGMQTKALEKDWWVTLSWIQRPRVQQDFLFLGDHL